MLIVILAAFGPLASGYYHLRGMIPQKQAHDQAVKNMPSADAEQALKEAYAYNRSIYAQQTGAAGDSGLLSRYDEILCVGKTSIMGRIKIPVIAVDLMIHHGADEKVLQSGAGHWGASSLPVGGKNTRAVLEGHRGLSSAALFTRLDELRKGDLFFIQVLHKTMAYEVDDIRVILPEQTDQLRIHKDRDEVTLVTCTPYSVNTHRLLVTGHRIPYKKGMEDNVQHRVPSFREMLILLARVLIILLVAAGLVRSARKGRQKCRIRKTGQTAKRSPDPKREG